MKYRFGVPPNIEANGYVWGKITTCIDYELTQARGKLKKVVSSFSNYPYRGGLKDQPAQERHEHCRCAVSTDHLSAHPGHGWRGKLQDHPGNLCSCCSHGMSFDLVLTLFDRPQRQAYPKYSGEDFWDKLDEMLDTLKSMPKEKKIRCVAPTRPQNNRSLYFHLVFSRRLYNATAGSTALLQVQPPPPSMTTRRRVTSRSSSNTSKILSRHLGVPQYSRVLRM